MRQVDCVKLKQTLPALDFVPHPGELGQRIYQQVSAQAWQMWLQQLQKIMQENLLTTADSSCFPIIEKFMLAWFFDEGDYAGMQFDDE